MQDDDSVSAKTQDLCGRETISVNKLFILCIMADNEVSQGQNERSTSVTILVDNETPVASDVVGEKSRSSSVAWSAAGDGCSMASLQRTRDKEKFRSLKRRSSVENFGQFGFLVPALALFPQADGVRFV